MQEKDLNDLIKIQGYSQNPYVLSELILMAKIMRKKNFKIQMLAGNRLKNCVGASFEIISTLPVTGYIYEGQASPLLQFQFQHTNH